MHVIGLDLGNASVKVVGPRGSDRTLVPHAVATAASLKRDPSLLRTGDEPEEHLHVSVASHDAAPAEIVVGTLAIREYSHLCQEVREGEQKATSRRHVILGLVAIATAIRKSDPSSSSCRLNLAVALPMAEVPTPEARKSLSSAFRGPHRVKWLSTPSWAGSTLDLCVQGVDVVPEGAVAYFELIQRRPQLQQGVTMILDVGGRSVDWAVFGPGGKYVPGLSAGVADGGITVAADRILATARATYGPHVARHRMDVLDALEAACKHDKRVILHGRGVPCDVSDIAALELDRVARDIARLATDVIDRTGRLDHLELVGGGSVLLSPYLGKYIPVPTNMGGYPQWSNAIGLYQRAVRL